MFHSLFIPTCNLSFSICSLLFLQLISLAAFLSSSIVQFLWWTTRHVVGLFDNQYVLVLTARTCAGKTE